MHTPDMGDPEGETLPEESEVFEVDEQISEKIQEVQLWNSVTFFSELVSLFAGKRLVSPLPWLKFGSLW